MARRRKSGGSKLPGSALLDSVRERLEQGAWPSGLTVLAGDDLYHLDRAQQALVEALAPADQSEFALTVFGPETVDVARVVAAARSRGMFAASRVVLVRELKALEGEPEPIQGYGKNPPAGSYLIVRAPDLDQRRKLHKALAGAGELLKFDAASLTGRELMTAVKAMAAERGIEPDYKATGLLIELCGADLNRIAAELDKLAAWKGGTDSARVGMDDVRELASGSAILSGWEVADAILLRDGAAAVAGVRRALARGDEPLRMLGGIGYRVRSMLQAKTLLDSGMSRGDVVHAARAWMYRDKLFRGLERYRLEELLAFPSLLLATDRALKSRSLDPGAAMERLVAALTAGGQAMRSAS